MPSKEITLSPAPSRQFLWHEIPDDLIKEILLRLPVSSVLGFLRVPKPWHSPTTFCYFLQHWGFQDVSFHHDPLALLLQNSNNERDFFLCSEVPQVNISGFSLNFLPKRSRFLTCNDPNTVMGSCDDLLLCSNWQTYQKYYFVVNPITRRWVALPPTLRRPRSILTGLVCETASIAEARKGGELRYRVVHIQVFEDSKIEFEVEIFSSKTGRWNDYSMTVAEWLTSSSCICRVVACNGNLYWQFHCGGVKVMELDLFNHNKGLQVIQTDSDKFHKEPKKHVLGVCRGKLRMYEMVRSEEASHVNIWELEDDQAKWLLVKVIRLRDILAATSSWWTRTLAIHPNDGDIIYVYLEGEGTGMNNIFCCNLKKMSMETERVCDPNKSYDSSFDVFPIPLPWTPTPIPDLPE